MAKKPVMLCIMDGFGWTPDETYGNAVVAANKPHLDALMKNYPMTTINASGMAVGLPDGQMGNSEVRREKLGVCGGQRLVTHPTVGAYKIIDTILVPHLASLEGSCLRSRLKGGSIGSSLSGSANS